MPEPLKATVSGIEYVSPRTRVIDLALDEALDFQPGQFISIEMTDHRTGTKTFRSYSIASCPSGPTCLQMCVSIHDDPESVGCTYLRNLKAGDEVLFRGPFGKFFFEYHNEKDIVFFAGGSGIAPIYSMILQIERFDIQQPIHLFYGVRHEEDLCYRKELEELAEKRSNFHFIPSVSDESEKGTTSCFFGFVTDAFEKYSPSVENTDFYLCGGPAMIEAIKEILSSKGVSDESIKMEAY